MSWNDSREPASRGMQGLARYGFSRRSGSKRDALSSLRPLAVAAFVCGLMAAPGSADEWLVYLGGGLEPIEGGWTEQRGQVMFRKTGGMLVSVPYPEVDLATSAFISWQLGGRTAPPPRASLPESEPEADAAPGSPCVPARVLGLQGSETFDVAVGETREIVHVACLDAPETEHKFQELGWFGRAALGAVEAELRKSNEVCLTEQVPPQRDRQGHRIVYVTLTGGRDFTAEAIAAGFGLLRTAACQRAAHYRRLEDRAIDKERGLWGAVSARAAFAAASHSIAVGAGPPAAGSGGAGPRAARGGGGG